MLNDFANRGDFYAHVNETSNRFVEDTNVSVSGCTFRQLFGDKSSIEISQFLTINPNKSITNTHEPCFLTSKTDLFNCADNKAIVDNRCCS